LNQSALLAAAAVLVVQQLLKSKIVPVGFANRHPVPTNLILSVVAVVIIKWQDLVGLTTWQDFLTQFGVIAVVAAVTYNQLIGRWSELRETEGDPTPHQTR
jgi:hypothetical protein